MWRLLLTVIFILNNQISATPAMNGGERGIKHVYVCPTTMPRYNLNLTKLMGKWYPVVYTITAGIKWSHAIQAENPNSGATEENCFNTEYTMNENDNTAMLITLSRGDGDVEEAAANGSLASTEHIKKGLSKWIVNWPHKVKTIMSIVATGSIPRNEPVYNWLLTVECDVDKVLRPEWAIFSRPGMNLTITSLKTIFSVLEGIRGLKHGVSNTYDYTDCVA